MRGRKHGKWDRDKTSKKFQNSKISKYVVRERERERELARLLAQIWLRLHRWLRRHGRQRHQYRLSHLTGPDVNAR